jgi:hypothetical protein
MQHGRKGVLVRKHFTYANVMSTLAFFMAVIGGGVAVANVPNNSVTSAKIVDETIKHQDIKDGLGVRGMEVVDGTLGSIDVLDDSLTGSDLATDSVGSAEIAADAVGSSEIAVGAVAISEIASNAVGSDEIATGAVGSDEIAFSAVGTSEIGDNQVGAIDILSGAVETDEIRDGQVFSVDIADSAVDAAEIGDGVHTHSASTSVAGGTAHNGAYNTGTISASCEPGEELISGGASWNNNLVDEEVFISDILLDTVLEQVTVVGGNDSGNDRTLVASALCLEV